MRSRKTPSGSSSPKAPVRFLPTVIFDGDDTLWENQVLYDRCKRLFAKCVSVHGLPAKNAIRILDVIDYANAKKAGFAPSRFPNSLVQAYRLICAAADSKPQVSCLRQLKVAGKNVFTKRPKILPGAICLLTWLQGRARRILLTAGNKKVQRFKIRSARLRKYFEKIYIYEAKNKEILEEILQIEGISPRQAVMVGNSPKSDIAPAIGLGMRAIWIDRAQWHFDSAELNMRGVKRVRTLWEVKMSLAKFTTR